MPSNATTNYQLNQWSAEDQVRRIDFNADNAKIDAAIKAVDQRVDALSASKADKTALAAEASAREAVSNALTAEVQARTALAAQVDRMTGLHLLKTGTPSTEAAKSYTIDLSDIQWTDWKTVYLLIELNGSAITLSNSINGSGTNIPHGHNLIIFHPLYDGDLYAVGYNPRGGVYSSDISLGHCYKDEIVVYLYAANDYIVGAGTTFKVWGER